MIEFNPCPTGDCFACERFSGKKNPEESRHRCATFYMQENTRHIAEQQAAILDKLSEIIPAAHAIERAEPKKPKINEKA